MSEFPDRTPDESAVDALLSETFDGTPGNDDLRAALLELRALGSRPAAAPTGELAALLPTDTVTPVVDLAARRRRATALVALATVGALALGTGAAAAASPEFRAGAAETVTTIIRTVVPGFGGWGVESPAGGGRDIPKPGSDDRTTAPPVPNVTSTDVPDEPGPALTPPRSTNAPTTVPTPAGTTGRPAENPRSTNAPTKKPKPPKGSTTAPKPKPTKDSDSDSGSGSGSGSGSDGGEKDKDKP